MQSEPKNPSRLAWIFLSIAKAMVYHHAISEAKNELKGVTLESLVVAERVARAVRNAIARGVLNEEDFPLLLHIDDIITRERAVNIPWEKFTYTESV